jgi:exopolysaccharide/PEP-CTERM locus tyrosine autokinase
MSLIEDAARRLEELRRAGAELPESAPAAAGAAVPRSNGAPPIPEAMIQVIEEQGLGSAVPLLDPAKRSSAPRSLRPDAPSKGQGQYVELNLARLRSQGFVTPDAATSRIADEFRVIKRPIIKNALGQGDERVRHGNLIMVTSSLPGEGKTFTSINLAMSIAMEYDSRVLLVDGDVAHPSMPGMLGTPHSPGLLDLLTRDDIDVADALVKTNVERLTLLPAGSRQRRSTELLASEQMASLLRDLASRYSDRIVIFDSPPLLATTEARVLATHMGQIMMVVAADATSHHALNQALGTIESCDIVLMLLNKASQTDVGTYYGYYGDGSDR